MCLCAYMRTIQFSSTGSLRSREPASYSAHPKASRTKPRNKLLSKKTRWHACLAVYPRRQSGERHHTYFRFDAAASVSALPQLSQLRLRLFHQSVSALSYSAPNQTKTPAYIPYTFTLLHLPQAWKQAPRVSHASKIGRAGRAKINSTYVSCCKRHKPPQRQREAHPLAAN